MSDHDDSAPRDTGDGWRWASILCLVSAVICFGAFQQVRSTPTEGDYVTGAINFFGMLAILAVICTLGVVFGLVEIMRPYEQRHRWCGAALWANVLFIFGVASWLVLTSPVQ